MWGWLQSRGWKGRGWIRLDVHLALGWESLSQPGFHCAPLAQEKGTAHIALCALQPHPLPPSSPQSSISSESRSREKRFLQGMSHWSAPYCLAVTKISFAETILA